MLYKRQYKQKCFECIQKRIFYYNQLNVLKLFGIEDSELAYSNFISNLLSFHRLHGISDALLKAFISEMLKCGHYNDVFSSDDLKNVNVLREDFNIDIKIELPNCKTVIVIENKWNADERTEGDDNGQLCKYRKYVESDHNYCKWRKFYVFLTVDGHSTKVKSEEKFWIPMSYVSISNALDIVLHSNLDERMKIYIEDCKKIIDIKTKNDKFLNMNKAEFLKYLDENESLAKDIQSMLDEHYRNDIIELFRKDGIEFNGKHLDAEKFPSKSRDYVQFMHMMPDNITNSIHFEVIKRGNYISPEFHVECNTNIEAKNKLKKLYHDVLSISSSGSMKLCGKKIKYKHINAHAIKKDVEVELCKLIAKVIPMLKTAGIECTQLL